jgi:phage baseplate assembly protein W
VTIKGERLGNPTFGSDLMRIIFDQDAGDIGDRIEEAIRTSISEWLPYVTVEQVETVTDERNPNLLNVSINFTIDIDQRVEQLDLNLKLADQGTIGQVGGESKYDELTDSIIGDGEYDTLDPFYSL